MADSHYIGDLAVDGTFTLNGVEIGTSLAAAGGLAALALANSLGATSATTGCIGAGSGTTILKVTAQSSPNLTVQIAAGTCFIAGVLAGDVDGVASLSGFAAPSANPRIDLVQISNAGVISRKAGTENASPVAPTVDAGNMALATVYNRVGQTSIKNTSDGSNGYITDARTWIA